MQDYLARPQTPFHIRRTAGGALRLSGELDLAGRPALREGIASITGECPDLLIDASELTFIDSEGVAELIEAWRGLPDGGRLVVADPTPFVRRVLALTGFQSLPNVVVAPEPRIG